MITNCTFSMNMADSLGGGIWSRGSPTITNCILWGDSAPEGPEIAVVFESTLTVRYSDVQGGESSVSIHAGCVLEWQEGNIDSNPLFVGGGDYHLSSGSPCIDAGDPYTSYNDACIPPSMGTERNDMGAYGGPGVCTGCDRDHDGYLNDSCGGDDCDDSGPETHPGAAEFCDGWDNDCDGAISDDEADTDGDGWMICEDDCDDSNPETYPGAEEVCDGNDSNCDGIVDNRDMDEDGYIDSACGGTDCDDTGPETHPGAAEFCDGRDNDCDGAISDDEADIDGDGWMICEGDCDDTDPDVNPDAAELCTSGIDEDCDGLVDEEDPDCPGQFTLELDAFYAGGTLSLEFTLGVPYPAMWSVLLILTEPTVQIQTVWTLYMPEITPPVDAAFVYPYPSVGWVGIFTGLYLDGLPRALDLAWVDTGK